MKKNNKISNALIILIVTMLVFMSLPITQASVRPNVIVSSYSIKEKTVSVGQNFVLVVNLKETEPAMCAQSITTTFSAGFPFIMDGVANIPAGDLCSEEIKTVEFPLKIDPTANGGFYQVKISNDYESNNFVQFSSSSTINIFVQGSPEMNAIIINSLPLDIYPGDVASLTFKIENNGGYQAQSVMATLSANPPIEVKWAKSSNSFPVILPKNSNTLDFSIEVPKDALAKEYPMRLIVKYLDENLVEKTSAFDFMLVVKKKAQFETSDLGSDKLYANVDSNNVKLNLKNTGTDIAKKIKVKILPQFPFSTDGSVRYVETIDAKKDAPINFVVDVDKDATPGTYSLDLLIDFEDMQGKKFQDTAKVALTVEKKDAFRAIFKDYIFFWSILGFIVIVIVIRKIAGKKKK